MCFQHLLWALTLALSADVNESRQATGVKVGEVTQTSAIVWMRVTAKAEGNKTGQVQPKEGEPLKVEELKGACPGAAGRVRLRYATTEAARSKTTNWIDVTEKTDFSHQFKLTDLKPGTVYHYTAETTGPGGAPVHKPLMGRFETAPPADQYADVAFTVITGQAYKDLDDADGFHIYPAMAALKPKFIAPTGDTVYYDSDPPVAASTALARYHWHRMYGLPRHIDFHLKVPGYWEKDDHDAYADDCWPEKKVAKMGDLTFPEGLRIFREQVPMGEKTYRTQRWGKALQVWVVEGRDFRSPNSMKDGPDKTIWGDEQKKWLMKSLLESDADWKVLVSPTPIVGPDRTNKGDNHANVAFTHEGNEFRQWVQKNLPKNFFVMCGDRHWQYHSVHPETGVQDISCGPASDQHASGTPGENPEYHRFHRVKGGFASCSVSRVDGKSTIVFRLHDVNGKVVYEFKRTQE